MFKALEAGRRRAWAGLVLGLSLGAPVAGAGFDAESIPVRVVRDRFVIVPVTVNGSGPYPFLLDTGSSTSIVAPALAARLLLASAGSTLQQTATAARRAALVRVSL
ncbi:MAG TPA: aspartyl protease family protein, partial [Vicinamibacteria bacterium]|nr:aspartyl protease family protein [Vicinamibacteria bacterium]